MFAPVGSATPAVGVLQFSMLVESEVIESQIDITIRSDVDVDCETKTLSNKRSTYFIESIQQLVKNKIGFVQSKVWVIRMYNFILLI